MKRLASANVLLAIGAFLACGSQHIASEDVQLRRIESPLAEWLDRRPHSLPGTGADPSAGGPIRSGFARALNLSANQQWAEAAREFTLVGYEIARLEPGPPVVIYESSGAGVGPTVVLNPSAQTDLIIGVPHPGLELATTAQGAAIFTSLGARALVVAGAHRCSSQDPSPCSGKTRVCSGSRESYRVSDVAHNCSTLFQVAHEVLGRGWSNSVVVQLHGMRPREAGKGRHDDNWVVLSDGTTKSARGANFLLTRLRDALRREIGGPHHLVVACHEPGDDGKFRRARLCGTSNVQGRFLNGSADSCTRGAARSSGRFVHIEQSPDVLSDDPPGRRVLQALRGALGSEATP
jgi:hypothetical protein